MNQDEALTQTGVTDIWEWSGHDLGHAPCRHGPSLVSPLLLCTYKALAVADLHYDSYENKQRPLCRGLCEVTRLDEHLKTEKAGKHLKFVGCFRDCAEREDILPLIPWCQPVLCCVAEAVAKKLNELAMNFPPRLLEGGETTLKGYSTHKNYDMLGPAVTAVLLLINSLIHWAVFTVDCGWKTPAKCTFFSCYFIHNILLHSSYFVLISSAVQREAQHWTTFIYGSYKTRKKKVNTMIHEVNAG